jgi:hypothetical protein
MVGGGADTSAVSGLCDHPVSTEVPLVIDESTPFRDVLVSFSRSLRVISDQAGHYDLVTSQGRGSQRYDAVDRLMSKSSNCLCLCQDTTEFETFVRFGCLCRRSLIRTEIEVLGRSAQRV